MATAYGVSGDGWDAHTYCAEAHGLDGQDWMDDLDRDDLCDLCGQPFVRVDVAAYLLDDGWPSMRIRPGECEYAVKEHADTPHVHCGEEATLFLAIDAQEEANRTYWLCDKHEPNPTRSWKLRPVG